MRITIPDALADHYTQMGLAANLSLDEVVTRQLAKVKHVSVTGRTVVLGAETLEYLERRCGGGPIASAKEVEARVMRLASISFMGKDLQLSPGQLEELSYRATRQGKPVDALIAEIAQRLLTDFFWATGASAQVTSTVPLPVNVKTPSLDGLAGG